MGVLIKHVRIKNYRSLENIDVVLNMTNILIGQNNSGKSNFLKAIDISLNGSRTISGEDIFVRNGEKLSKDKPAIIDIQIVPTDDKDKKVKNFSEFWVGVFTDKWITTDETKGDFVGIRTIIEFDHHRNDYVIVRKPIQEWNESIEVAKVGGKQQFGSDMMDYMKAFYMDAQRDVSDDIKDKKSYFGKATSQVDLTPEKIEKLEKQLNDVNSEIIDSIPALQKTSEEIAAIGNTLGEPGSSIRIDPLARKLDDLHKGMDITFKDGKAAGFSVSQHGMGTRSWISFLTLGAYVDWCYDKIKEDDPEADDFVILTLEEPEAHLHPQAQRQLYDQIRNFRGQKIVSTHSSSILAQAELEDIIHFFKRDGVTHVQRFKKKDYQPQDIDKIQREVIKTRGELLFSNAIVLCEGITEEQALPIYFKEYFGTEAIFREINIIGVGGQNYKPFLNLIKNFDIDWYIFSDGERLPIKGIKNAVKVITNQDIKELKNVIILDNGDDFEKFLLREGYGQEIVKAVNKYMEDDNYYQNYVNELKENKQKKIRRVKTDKPPCPTCGQDIYEDVVEAHTDGLNEEDRKIYSCITSKKNNAKARFAMGIAQEIVKCSDINRRIPSKVLDLFKVISKKQGLKVRREYSEVESITSTEKSS